MRGLGTCLQSRRAVPLWSLEVVPSAGRDQGNDFCDRPRVRRCPDCHIDQVKSRCMRRLYSVRCRRPLRVRLSSSVSIAHMRICQTKCVGLHILHLLADNSFVSRMINCYVVACVRFFVASSRTACSIHLIEGYTQRLTIWPRIKTSSVVEARRWTGHHLFDTY